MFDESLKIHILDLTKSETMTGSVEEIFNHYIQWEKNNSIDFERLDVVIEDWTGWTKLERITRSKTRDESWGVISPNDSYYPGINDVVLCLPNTVIPVYEPDKSMKGFHGEIKYKYKTVPCCDMVNRSGYFRMRRLPRTESPFFYHIKCNVTSLADEDEITVYSIFTKSGFFNGNNFHLCSSDTRIEDEKELWK